MSGGAEAVRIVGTRVTMWECTVSEGKKERIDFRALNRTTGTIRVVMPVKAL